MHMNQVLVPLALSSHRAPRLPAARACGIAMATRWGPPGRCGWSVEAPACALADVDALVRGELDRVDRADEHLGSRLRPEPFQHGRSRHLACAARGVSTACWTMPWTSPAIAAGPLIRPSAPWSTCGVSAPAGPPDRLPAEADIRRGAGARGLAEAGTGPARDGACASRAASMSIFRRSPRDTRSTPCRAPAAAAGFGASPGRGRRRAARGRRQAGRPAVVGRTRTAAGGQRPGCQRSGR